MEKLKDNLIAVPVKQPNVGDIIEEISVLLLIKEIDIFVKQEQNYHQNKEKMYSVVIGQCTDATNNSLEAESTHKYTEKE